MRLEAKVGRRPTLQSNVTAPVCLSRGLWRLDFVADDLWPKCEAAIFISDCTRGRAVKELAGWSRHRFRDSQR
jgi:hypothetical protein